MTNITPRESLIGRQALAVVNFAPPQVGKHISEVPVARCPQANEADAGVLDMEAIEGGTLS